MERNIALNDARALGDLCAELHFQFASLEKHRTTHTQGLSIPKLQVYCNGLDVTDVIRSPELGLAASNVSKLPEVRQALIQVQRGFGEKGGIVMEGRDIGTVIFPDAEIKFFLTASLESRASRRKEELSLLGIQKDIEMVLKETSMRDEQDKNRSIAPLKQATDAIAIDSTHKSLEEVVGEMSLVVREYLKK
jgi:cytidylate kinase